MQNNIYYNVFRWSYLIYAVGIFFIYFMQPVSAQGLYYIADMPTYQKVFVSIFAFGSFYAFPVFFENHLCNGAIKNWHMNIKSNDIFYSLCILLVAMSFIIFLKLPVFALLMSCAYLKFFYLFANSWLRSFNQPLFIGK